MSTSQLPLEALLAIIILLLYTIAAPLFEKYKFHYMHESGLCMLIGIGITVVAMIISPENLKFDNEIFFTFILPPIIFAAGYNLRRRAFFKYFNYIFLFGVVGTIVTFSIVCPLTYLANKNQLFAVTFGKEIEELASHNLTINESSLHVRRLEYDSESSSSDPMNELFIKENLNDTYRSDKEDSISIDSSNFEDITPITPITPVKNDEFILNFSLREILLFSSVIAATDTVAALTFIKEENEPKLFAILFGEGVINDAVCIVLYGIIRDFTASNQEFTSKTPLIMLESFMNMFFFSFVVGSIVGCLSSVFLKKLKHIKLNRVQESSIIIFFAFISYTLTEEMGLSPIIALLFTGIFMSHYSFYNLSFQAREESSVVSRIMSNIAEAFVFTYLGLTVIYNTSMAFSLSFFFWELIFVVIGRVAAIFGISYVMYLLNIKNFKLKTSHKGIMSCAGSIRGAIAFGLAISIDTSNKINKEVLISSTLILVLFSTIVFGALMPLFIRFFNSFDPVSTEVTHNYVELDTISNTPGVQFDYLHPNFSQEYAGETKEKDESVLKQRLSYWFGTYWINFDEVYMKPKLIHNWPAVKHEHDNISKIIKDTIKNFKNEQKDKKEEADYRKQFEADNLDMKDKDEDYRRMSRDEAMYEEHPDLNESTSKKTSRFNTEESHK